MKSVGDQVVKSRYLSRLVLALIILGVSGGTALAYHVLGGTWSEGGPLHYHFGSVDTSSHTAFLNSAAAWNNAQSTVTFGLGLSTSPITLDDVNDSGVTWDGISFLNPCESCSPYTSATAELNTYWTLGHTGASPYSADKIQSVAAHELGHVLGLAHSTGAVLMNPATCGTGSRWCTYQINTPQTDDANGVHDLYVNHPQQ